MSLINEALKRAQRAQARQEPDYTLALEPVAENRGRGKLTRRLASVGAVLAVCIAVWFLAKRGQSSDDQDSGTPVQAANHSRDGARGRAPEGPSFALRSPNGVGAPAERAGAGPGRMDRPLGTASSGKAVRNTALPGVANPPGSADGTARIVRQESTVPDAPPETVRRTEKVATTGTPADLSVYVVRPRDTLTRIAHLHHTSLKALRDINGLRTDRIVVGQKLRIPAPVTQTPAG